MRKMKNMRTVFVAAALGAMLVTIGPAAWGADVKAAPDVSLQTEQGAPARLAAFKGKVVLVDFWASWCVPCKTSFPALEALHREFAPRGLAVLAVNLDEHRKDADGFLSAHPHTMPVLFDPAGAGPTAFGVKGMPTSFLIDRAGIIRFSHMGYTANIGQQYRQEIDLLISEH
jgi:thiol-disulfide isomerase/thioredoxin